MSADLQIILLSRSGPEVSRFLRVSYAIYQDDPHWVAPLLMDLKQVFTAANPLFQHAEMQLWVAVRNGRDVGRIAGIHDRHYVEQQKDPAAFFGFYECVPDAAVSGRLFEAVGAWARGRGLKRLLGPMNPTLNDECGLLVEGFESSPVLMMTYNPRYYLEQVAAAGLRKAKDLLAFHLDLNDCPLERLGRIADRVRKRWPAITVRPIRRRSLLADLEKIKEVYNEAWEANWGFVPMTGEEINFMAKRLKPLFMEGITWVAETAEEPVAFLLALPDFNRPLKPLRGRLLTPRVFGFLPYLLGWKRPLLARVIVLGTKKSYRGHGLESVMLAEGLRVGFEAGLREAEASWILEDNTMMCRVMETFGGRVYKRYRIYEREV